MNKMDTAYRQGFMISDEDVEEIKKIVEASDGDGIEKIMKRLSSYDYAMEITIYPKKDIGNPPYMAIFRGGNNESK